MQFKSLKLFPVVLVLSLLSLLVFGCGKQGSRFGNNPPSIQITSYEGYDPANVFTDSTEVTSFQQKIFWHATDPDGTIAGYAYRILDKFGNPMSTAGNLFIDTLGVATPQSVLNQYGSGWVMHYKSGADQSFPLSDPRAKRTIWSSQKYAIVNFIASNTVGLSDTTINRFEVICIDNRGNVCEEMAYRRFRSYSARPTCMLSTTKGDPSGDSTTPYGKQVGTGIRLSFTLDDADPFLQPTAWYYKFKVQKIQAVPNGSVISEVPSDTWVSTLGQEKINQYLLTKYTYPSLSSDYNESGVQQTYTRVIATVVDLAGVVSIPDTIKFAVKEGFHPMSLMHMKRVYALGSNHNIDYTDDSTPEVWPYTIENGSQLFATPFFRDTEGYYTAIKSSNLKSWIRWGWHGEYGTPLASGTTIITDDPYDKKVDMLLDEDTNVNYYSEITHFDIRLNGSPYNYPPFADSIIIDAGTGKKWLRVPVNSSLGQTIVLTNLPANTPDNPYHFFEVRAVDLQNEVDPTPAEFKFKIIDLIPKAQKSGILVIDDELNNPNFAPGDSIDARYANMLSNYSGEVVYRKRADVLYPDIKNRMFAASDLQRFKFIIYHADNPTQTSNLPLDQNAFDLYLKQGGNMLISGGGNMHGMIQAIILARQRTLETFFGLAYDITATASVTNSPLTNNWFVKAKSALAPYNDISLAFDLNATNPNPDPFINNGQTIVDDPNELSFVSYLKGNNHRKGLGPLTYFNNFQSNQFVKSIYGYGSKPVYVQPSNANPNYFCPQTTAQYNSVNDKVVGIKKATTSNSCYIVGFPLSYMTQTSAKQFMTTVVNEIMAK